jgi:hypothetical protein
MNVLEKPEELIQKVINGAAKRVNNDKWDFRPVVLPRNDPGGESTFPTSPRREYKCP